MFHNIIKDCFQNTNPNPFFIQTALIGKVGDDPKEKSILLDAIKVFFNKIMDKTQVELKYDSTLQYQFFKLYLKTNDVKYHDMINDYVEWSLPKKLLKKHKNYVDAFMDYYKFKGKKIKKYMNQIPKIDWFNLSWSYRTLGIDYFNKIDKKFFKHNNNSSYYLTNNLFNNPVELSFFILILKLLILSSDLGGFFELLSENDGPKLLISIGKRLNGFFIFTLFNFL
jgi:hypothetical protein